MTTTCHSQYWAHLLTLRDPSGTIESLSRSIAGATAHEKENGGKPSLYLLISHDAISDNKTLQGLAAIYAMKNA